MMVWYQEQSLTISDHIFVGWLKHSFVSKRSLLLIWHFTYLSSALRSSRWSISRATRSHILILIISIIFTTHCTELFPSSSFSSLSSSLGARSFCTSGFCCFTASMRKGEMALEQDDYHLSDDWKWWCRQWWWWWWRWWWWWWYNLLLEPKHSVLVGLQARICSW